MPQLAELTTAFPATRYQGSKAKLADWLWQQLRDLNFNTVLDAFGGSGAVAYRLKQAGKQVTYNDLLHCNYLFARALVENDSVRLSEAEVDWLLTPHHSHYPRLVQDTFPDIYYTDAENAWLDQTITNLRELADPHKYALGFFALAQACLVKRPYNLFHRKNLYLRLADVPRSFGNKTTWDAPFEQWFRTFAAEANHAVFPGQQPAHAINCDAAQVGGSYDLVYLDPPYISASGVGVDYLAFYHFLEGLVDYDNWAARVDYGSKHRRLKLTPSPWTDRKRIHAAFDELFRRYEQSIIVVSYRSDGIPTAAELVTMLRRYKPQVRVVCAGTYQYVLSTNRRSSELLILGE